MHPQPSSTLFPYTTLFRSARLRRDPPAARAPRAGGDPHARPDRALRSEEHTSELQSRLQLVCRLLPDKKKLRQSDLLLGRAARGEALGDLAIVAGGIRGVA